MPKPVIAIDGPAASGKGTLARELAKELNFAHLDTGAIYRMVALQLVQQNLDFTPEDAVKSAQYVQQNLQPEWAQNPELRADKVASLSSQVSAVPKVRDILLDTQRDFALNPPAPFEGAVLDGRDIGTIVCPEANVKLFVTASAEVRSQRRFKELGDKGIEITYDDVLIAMKERDQRDTSRDIAPLKPALDAIIIDTSELSAEAAFQEAYKIITEKLSVV